MQFFEWLGRSVGSAVCLLACVFLVVGPILSLLAKKPDEDDDKEGD